MAVQFGFRWRSEKHLEALLLGRVRYRSDEATEILSINTVYPPILGDFLKLGDTPKTPVGSILHHFLIGLHLFPLVPPLFRRSLS